MNRADRLTPRNRRAALQTVSRAYTAVVTALVRALTVVAGLGIVTMIGVTSLDVVLRFFGRPITGAFDIVRLAGALTIAREISGPQQIRDIKRAIEILTPLC